MFLLIRLWARMLFDYGASHSFIATSCVKDLGLEVETLEKLLYVNSPLGTRVSIDLICGDFEFEISGILIIVNFLIMDMLEFDVILRMDWLTTHQVVFDCDHRRVIAYTLNDVWVMFQWDKQGALPQVVYDSRWHGQLKGWLENLTLEDEVRQELGPSRVVYEYKVVFL